MSRYILMLLLMPITLHAADIDLSGIDMGKAKNKLKSVNVGGSILDDAIDKTVVDFVNSSRARQKNGTSNTSMAGNEKYSCKFHCVGRWDAWRGPENTVLVNAKNQADAEDNVKKGYAEMCMKYPFHEGGGGNAGVGNVQCGYY